MVIYSKCLLKSIMQMVYIKEHTGHETTMHITFINIVLPVFVVK
jgi:hypothetical protein